MDFTSALCWDICDFIVIVTSRVFHMVRMLCLAFTLSYGFLGTLISVSSKSLHIRLTVLGLISYSGGIFALATFLYTEHPKLEQ